MPILFHFIVNVNNVELILFIYTEAQDYHHFLA